jgi:hypothetical protein
MIFQIHRCKLQVVVYTEAEIKPEPAAVKQLGHVSNPSQNFGSRLKMSKRTGLVFLHACSILLVQGFLAPRLASFGTSSSNQPKQFATKAMLLNPFAKNRRPAALTPTMTKSVSPSSLEHETDFVVIGSGLGGLSAASLLVFVLSLSPTKRTKRTQRRFSDKQHNPAATNACLLLQAKYGYGVTVCESHYLPGGCAHGFEIRAKNGGGIFKYFPTRSSSCANPPQHPSSSVFHTPSHPLHHSLPHLPASHKSRPQSS